MVKSTQAAKDEQEELKLKIRMDGKTYEIKFNDFNGLDARAFRQELGMSLAEAFTSNPDVDILAGLVWLERRKTRRRLTYDEVAAEFTYSDLIESHKLAAEEEENGEVVDVEESDPSG